MYVCNPPTPTPPRPPRHLLKELKRALIFSGKRPIDFHLECQRKFPKVEYFTVKLCNKEGRETTICNCILYM